MEMNSFLNDESFSVDDKLSHQIFALLENKFLFGSQKNLHLLTEQSQVVDKSLLTDLKKMDTGKVRVLSIDAGGSTDGILAARSLALLESSLRQKYQKPEARVADFFDLAIGSGIGGILAALLFTKGKEGRPVFTASEALDFVARYRRKLNSPSSKGVLGRVLGSSKKLDKAFQVIFGENTLKDTLKPVLIPSYDLATRSPLLFSRADAFENDGFDFKMSDVCTATLADATLDGAFRISSVDSKTRITVVGGGVAMNNPTAAAITHVLNNKQEFPFCDSVGDLLVVSLGNGVSGSGSVPNFVNIGREAASDVVDEAVSMAFGSLLTSNYVRIQGNGFGNKKSSTSSSNTGNKLLETADNMLNQKNVESILFRGKKVTEKTNSDKLQWLAEELVKEQERRKFSIFPTVMYKQSSPRTSSATVSTVSSH